MTSPAAGSEELREQLTRILDDLDLTCPRCHDEGHGGDGCQYCWQADVNPRNDALNANADAIMQLIAAQNNATYEAVMEAIPNIPFVSFEQCRTAADYQERQALRKLVAELRQSIAKIYGKEDLNGDKES